MARRRRRRSRGRPRWCSGSRRCRRCRRRWRTGATVDVKFGQKALAGARAGTRAEGVRVEISGCVGARPAVRAYIRVSMATAANDNMFTIYGSPHLL
ncbi:MspA family porin [Gordonia spumicola]|uniref:MspA family porin n=1 Tax=Gordonia spumicola TaxID=589161 RepID=UPI00225DE9DC|nr:MspA family porin [Gordonia spumicola]